MTAHVDRCAEWRSLASCELDGELDELDTARLKRHLQGCAECSVWLAELRTLTAMLRDAQLEAPRRGLDLSAVRRGVGRAAVAAATVASVAAAALAVIGFDLRTNNVARPAAAGGFEHHALTSLAGDTVMRGRLMELLNVPQSFGRQGRFVE